MNYGATMGSMFIPEGSRTSAYMPACFKFRVPHHSQPTTPTPPSPPPDLLAWKRWNGRWARWTLWQPNDRYLYLREVAPARTCPCASNSVYHITPSPPHPHHQAPLLTSLLGKDGMEDGRDEACRYPRMKTCIQEKSHQRVRVRVLPIPCPTSLPAHFTHTILPQRTVPKSALKCHKLAYLSADMHINTWSRIRAYPHVRIARRHNRIHTCMKTRACTCMRTCTHVHTRTYRPIHTG